MENKTESQARLKTAKNPEHVDGSSQVPTTYDYDDASNLLTKTNPNTTTVTFTYNGMNRVKTKTLSTGGLWNYSYDTGTNGKGRLVSVVTYGGTSANNGNIGTQAIRIGSGGTTTTINQSYGYDNLNRLHTASETGSWSQTYDFDQYGNRWVSGGYIAPGNESLTPRFSTDFNTGTNRLNASLYDWSGNQTRDGAERSFTYDAENHQVTGIGIRGHAICNSPNFEEP